MRAAIPRHVVAAVLVSGLAALVGIAALVASRVAAAAAPARIEIEIHYSHFNPSEVEVPLGVPVTFVLRNDDPIDHEWIVGDEAVHARHRTSSDPVHEGVPTEVSIPAGTTQVTTVTFQASGRLAYICHLPGHEAYGMVGWVTIAAP